MYKNADNLKQILTQKFLILRASCTLNLTLLGHDFLTKNEAKLLYKPSGISLLLNDICIKTEGQSANITFYIKHAHFLHPNLHANPQNKGSSFQTSHEDFMALYNMNQYEKAFHFYQKQVDVFSAQDLALKEVEEICETHDAPQADLNHLTNDEQGLLEPILKEYSSLFRRHKFPCGLFPHFRAEARMN